MICYRDMIFCSFYKDCADKKDCGRALTEEIAARAKEYGLGICQFMNKPDCFKKIHRIYKK